MIDFQKQTIFNTCQHDHLSSHAQHCQSCTLHSNRTKVVFHSGPTNANLMIIGEGPGKEEDEQGLPFIGRSGQLLTQILESAGIDRQQIYIANTVKCRPPKNRTPKPDEIKACQDYLIRQIQLVQPKIICLLGAAALNAVLGKTKTITKIRGQWILKPVNYMADKLRIMPLFHPSYLLRFASKKIGTPKWLTKQDLKEVKAALNFYDIMTTS